MVNETVEKLTQGYKIPQRAWLTVGLLCVVGCLNYLDRTMITTMRSSIIVAIPMNDAQFGLLTSLFLWIYGILSPFAGYLADRFNRSRVIIVSLFVWSLVTWMTSYATTYEELLFTRALMGVSEACYIPAALALITDYHKGNTRSLAIGIHMGGVMIGQSLGFIGGWIAETRSWDYAFSIMGLIGILYCIILIFSLRDNSTHISKAASDQLVLQRIDFKEAIISLFSKKDYLKTLAYWSFFGVVGWLVVGWLPTYYKEHFELSQKVAGIYATGYLYIASLGGVLFGGFLADRWSRSNPRARILVPAIGLLIAAPGIFIASSTEVLYLAVVCFMIYAFTRGFTDANMMPILCMVTDKRYRATGYGILNLFSCIVGGIGLYVGGVLRDATVNLSLIFQVAAISIVCCALLLFWLKPTSYEND